MYTLYLDKYKEFECVLDVSGTSLSKTKARLVIENKDANLLFEGKVDTSTGKCKVPLNNLKTFLDESTTGQMKLEVIADDTFFSPWEDSFKCELSKKVTVEGINSEEKDTLTESKAKVKVTIREDKEPSLTEILGSTLKEKGITRSNFKQHKSKIFELVNKYAKHENVTPKEMLTGIWNKL